MGGDSRGTGGGGMQENSGDLSDDNMAITSGHGRYSNLLLPTDSGTHICILLEALCVY